MGLSHLLTWTTYPYINTFTFLHKFCFVPEDTIISDLELVELCMQLSYGAGGMGIEHANERSRCNRHGCGGAKNGNRARKGTELKRKRKRKQLRQSTESKLMYNEMLELEGPPSPEDV